MLLDLSKITITTADSLNKTELNSMLTVILNHRLHYSQNSAIENLCRKVLFSAGSNYRYKRLFTWIKNKEKHSRPFFIVSVIYYDGLPVGCFILQAFYSSFYVLPKYRRQGLAEQMFTYVSKRYDLSHKVENHGTSFAAKGLSKKLKISH